MFYDGYYYCLTRPDLFDYLAGAEGYDENQAWEIACRCSAKSPYQRYKKTPYPYTFPRCSHSHTHSETFAIGEARERRRVQVECCDVCKTIRSEPKFLPHPIQQSFKQTA
jgi:hypothetical protein